MIILEITYTETIFENGKPLTEIKDKWESETDNIDAYISKVEELAELEVIYKNSGIEATFEESAIGQSAELYVRHSDSISSWRKVEYKAFA